MAWVYALLVRMIHSEVTEVTMASVVTFGQLPDEEPSFLAYLLKSGDVWARR